MSHKKNSHRQNAEARIYVEVDPYDLPFDDAPGPANTNQDDPFTGVALEPLLRAHRWELVQEARRHLGAGRRADAEDLVQELCLEALEGLIALAADPAEALEDLLREIAARCGRDG